MSDVEKRCFMGEVRTDETEGQPVKIIGYASVFDSRSELICGCFREIIKPGAFDGVLNDDVRGLFNHDPNYILGRTRSKTLSLSVDDRGLRYEILAPTTPTITDLVLSPMRRGDISQSSFAFRVARDGERWYQDDEGVIVREITRFSRLYDVSPVTYPAYTEADSAVRSMEAWRSQRDAQKQPELDAIIQREKRARILTLLDRS